MRPMHPYCGPASCFRPTTSSRFVQSWRSTAQSTIRLSAGSMTWSTSPRSDAGHGLR